MIRVKLIKTFGVYVNDYDYYIQRLAYEGVWEEVTEAELDALQQFLWKINNKNSEYKTCLVSEYTHKEFDLIKAKSVKELKNEKLRIEAEEKERKRQYEEKQTETRIKEKRKRIKKTSQF